MSIVLARIDSRLVHGQVLEAWVPYVNADCIVVANDEVAAVSFQCMVMQAAIPSSIKLVIGTLEETVGILSSADLLKKRVLLLFTNSEDALEVRQLGVASPHRTTVLHAQRHVDGIACHTVYSFFQI